MSDFCSILLYASMTFTNTTVDIEGHHFLFKWNKYGYTVTTDEEVMIANSERRLLEKFKHKYCPDDYVDVSPKWVME